jgi:hypothetical protein
MTIPSAAHEALGAAFPERAGASPGPAVGDRPNDLKIFAVALTTRELKELSVRLMGQLTRSGFFQEL